MTTTTTPETALALWAELQERALRQQVLSLLVHAGSKVGKTTLASTAPKPILLLDAEGGSKFLPHSKTYWDPLTGPPPNWDGSWEICVVIVRQFDTLAHVYQWLVMHPHHFRSLCIDSITEVQRRCKEQLVGTSDMKQQNWGTLLTKMEQLIRQFRDLTLHPSNPLSAAVFIAETRQTNGKWIPYMQGQIATSLPYLMDVIGYLYVSDVPDEYDPLVVHKERQLLVVPHPQFEAGERVQGRLGDVVRQPDVSSMLTTVYPT